MYNTVIFDIDGTLSDSSIGIKQAVRYTINKQHLRPLEEDVLNEFIACSPLIEAFRRFCNIKDENTAKECVEIYGKFYAKNSVKFSKVYDGVIELLDYLSENNFKLAVATYKTSDNAKLLLKTLKLDKYFSSICAADTKNILTKKDILNNCITALNSPVNDCIFIGDSPVDGHAAKSLGCGFIAVTYGFGFAGEADTKEYSPILTADNMEQIREFFNKLLQNANEPAEFYGGKCRNNC